MSVTAGALSQVSVGATTASLLSAVATGGTGPYTYQWYRSTTTGFSPGAGTLIAGATSLTLNDSGLTPLTNYFYKVVATDTGAGNATSTATQLAVSTTATTLSPNVFSQSPIVGMLDLQFDYDTVSAVIDASQSGSLYAGQAVKITQTSLTGVPQVIACVANTDEVFGFINFDIKTVAYKAGTRCELSQSGNVMYLYSTGAITRGDQVTSATTITTGGVAEKNSGDRIVGFAYDGAAGAGVLIRVKLSNPSYTTA
jgi:hypothetical protein